MPFPNIADDLDAGPSCSFKSPVLETPRCFSPSQEPLAFSSGGLDDAFSVDNRDVSYSPVYETSPQSLSIHNPLNDRQQLFSSDEEDVDGIDEVPCTQDAYGTSPKRFEPIRNPLNVCQQLFPSDEEDIGEPYEEILSLSQNLSLGENVVDDNSVRVPVVENALSQHKDSPPRKFAKSCVWLQFIP